MPMATKYAAIVIGTGQAGSSLAVRLADTGVKVAIIEGKRFGGTCVNNGRPNFRAAAIDPEPTGQCRGADGRSQRGRYGQAPGSSETA